VTGRSCLTVPSSPFTFSDVLVAVEKESEKERGEKIREKKPKVENR
jgi:hypothetical protein